MLFICTLIGVPILILAVLGGLAWLGERLAAWHGRRNKWRNGILWPGKSWN